MKQNINVYDSASQILNALKTGVLLTTKAGGKVNTMTISWGKLGIEWGKPIFTVFVRDSRYTKELIDSNPEFTINIPCSNLDPKILGICGSKSGRDIDKIEQLGLTLEPSNLISVPAIKELPLTLECKVIYKQKQVFESIQPEYQKTFYPLENNNHNIHTAYYGEIVDAYIIKD